MAITEIKYGSLASSKELNDNFNALNKDIQDLATNLSTTNANMATSMSTLNKNVANQISEVNESLTNTKSELEEKVKTLEDGVGEFATSGLYITHFISENGKAWYREYFSNKEKTTRVWLEQGGVLEGGGDYNRQVVFLKNFSNTNYTILKNSGSSSTGGVAARWMGFWGLDVASAWTGYINHSECWYACGI